MPEPFPFPRTLSELDAMLDNDVGEGIHLDYKASAAVDRSKRSEIAKDVSAFANSDGGVLVYGVGEDKVGNRFFRDAGVDRKRFKAEWFDQIFQSSIAPRIAGIEIVEIRYCPDRSCYSIRIPRSTGLVHQERESKLFYKRFALSSVPMEEYEMNDVRNRVAVDMPLVRMAIELRKKSMCFITLENPGNAPAYNLTFTFSPELKWVADRDTPRPLRNGIRCLLPKKKHYFFYNMYHAIVDDKTPFIPIFEIEAKYFHPLTEQNEKMTFAFDLNDHLDSMAVESDVYGVGEILEKLLPPLTKNMEKLNDSVREFLTLRGATGLDLSFSTIKSLEQLIKGEEPIEPYDPRGISDTAFHEILGVNWELAGQLYRHFYGSDDTNGIENLEGMTPDVLERFFKYFKRRRQDAEEPDGSGVAAG